jgi:hypothetical protein
MRWLAVGLLFSAGLVCAQTSIPPASSPQIQEAPQLSPQAAYAAASRPLDIVRKPVANWSEVEQAALDVAMRRARVACAERSPHQYAGEDLLDYARLCAFAQSWRQVQQAATGYLIAQSAATPAEKLAGFPNLSMAFDYEVQASLHLKDSTNAFGTAQTMLRTVAYDDLASDAINSVVRYVQLIQTDQALALLEQRQPQLLAMLKARGAPTAPVAATPQAVVWIASSRPALSIHELYSDAMGLPTMQQFAKKPEESAASFAAVEAVLPAKLSPDDAILTASARRQYKLLGAPLPAIAASASLLNLAFSKAPDLNRKNASAGALLLFPDWCAQCVAMYPLFKEVNNSLKSEGVHFYALLAQANPQPPARKHTAKSPAKGASRSSRLATGAGANAEVDHIAIQVGQSMTAADQLVGTPTLIVPAETVDAFSATDFPLIIVTDGCGIVRYVGLAPENALVEGGVIFQVAERVLQQWPVVVLRTAVGLSIGEERRCGEAI